MPVISAEVAIVGGGLMGCWTAYFLRQRGRSVIVAEKGVVGAQASGVNFGNLRLQGRFPKQYPLALRAHELWERFETLMEASCEFAATGHLRIAFTADEMRVLEEHSRDAAPYGLELRLMDRRELSQRWPWLSPVVIGASFSPRDAVANPRIAAPAVARKAKVLGAEIIEGLEITAIEKTGRGFRLATRNDVTIECERLVNAAGAWGSDIAAGFGEPVPLFAAGPPQFVTEPIPYFMAPSVQAVDGSVIVRQIPRGNVIASGYPRGASDKVLNRAPVSPHKIAVNMGRLVEVVPALAACQIIRVWSGIEGYIPDMLPVLGPSQTTGGLIHAFGFCGHGFQLAPGVGQTVSELVIDGATPIPLEPFSIARFASGTVAENERLRHEFDGALLGPPKPH
jgi:sarcosine oxidase subunit beta